VVTAVVQMATRRTHEVNAPPAMMARVKGTPRSDSKFETIETAAGSRSISAAGGAWWNEVPSSRTAVVGTMTSPWVT
jgi:predicted oxidoreductase